MELIDILPGKHINPNNASEIESIVMAREFAVTRYLNELESLMEINADLALGKASIEYQHKLNLINALKVLSQLADQLAEISLSELEDLPDDYELTNHELVKLTVALKIKELTNGSV